ncbi:MAG: N-acetyltransferase family protein [Candidatus Kariarchaeaceae archaeon]
MDFEIRPIDVDDIPKIIDIYELITRKDGPDADDLEARIEYGHMFCLGAEKDGKFIGFILGSSDKGSFGELETIGTIGLLGVHPDHRNQNIGRALGQELIAQYRALGITKIRTRVDNNDTDLLKYFMNIGLKPSNWTMLELEV